MSGGVGPAIGGGGITLPSSTAADAPTTSHFQLFHLSSLKQLNAMGAMTILAASTTVPVADIAFAVLSLPYLLLLAALSFPAVTPTQASTSPVFTGPIRLLLTVHTVVGFLLGVLLPAIYILDGLRTGDTAGVAAASPHAFLLAAQVFTEGIVAAWPRHFSVPVRAAVPVLYNTRRMFTAAEWVREQMEKHGEVGVGLAVPQRRLVAGQALAVANLAFWGVNLFAFLVPVYLPRALRRYYCSDGGGCDGDAKEEPEARKKDS